MAIIPQSLFVISLLVITCLVQNFKHVVAVRCGKPPVCECNTNMTEVDCDCREITSIPDLPVSALRVFLTDNNIAEIPPRAFSDMSKLQQLDLRSNSIQTLTPNSFEGLHNLTALALSENKINKIPSHAFSDLSKLQYLWLENNKIQRIEQSAFEGLDSLTNLDLSNNNIHTIKTRLFSNLPKLKGLQLVLSHIQTIEQFAFEGLDSLTYLDLCFNNISTLTPSTFSNLSKLENLYLLKSQIHTVEPFAFDALQNIKRIDMHEDKLQTLVSMSFANMPKLESLRLGYNKIDKIADDAFTGTERISVIFLEGNLLSEIPSIGHQHRLNALFLFQNQIVNATFPSSYRNCCSNLLIDLSHNKIEALDVFTFSSLAGTTVKNMTLIDNNITIIGRGTFEPLESIEILYIGHNPLSTETLKYVADYILKKNVTFGFFNIENEMTDIMKLGLHLGICGRFSSKQVFKDYQNITIIQLTTEDLIEFSSRYFPGKKNVLAIDLAGMDISSFPEYLPTSLESLDLRGNKIAELVSNGMSHLGSLKVLLLTGNKIGTISPDAFNGLGSLQVLDLAQNGIEDLSETTLNPLYNLTKLHLAGNQIKLLRKVTNPLVSLIVLDLSDNGIESVDAPFSVSFPYLHALNLKGNSLGKTVFTADIGNRLFSGLTKLEGINIVDNNIHDLPDMIFHDLVSLRNLNLSMNKLSGWGSNTFRYRPTLAELDISFNLIPALKEENLHYLSNLNELHLNGNPFICNCDLLWFRKWIDSTSVPLPDKEFYSCHGPDEWRDKKLLDFTEEKINCSTIPVIIGAVAGAIVFTAMAGLLIYRHRWRVYLRLYLLSKRRIRFIRLREDRELLPHPDNEAINVEGRADLYDAYISCNENDYDWVLHHLLPGIDSGDYANDGFGGEFHLYYDPRDQEPGTRAIGNIFEHMSRSRKVIVVLTPDYVKDGRNLFELDQAATRFFDQDLEDIIVIKVGAVSPRSVPAQLYTQMRRGQFLEWEGDVHAVQRFKECLKDRLRGERVDLC